MGREELQKAESLLWSPRASFIEKGVATGERRGRMSRECIHVERSLLEPSRVVDDERERAETDLAALHQNSAKNHDDLDRKRSQLLQQIAKTPTPRWAPTVVVLSLTVEWGG